MSFNNKNYFFIDTKWYKILDNFINNLNDEFRQLIYPIIDNNIINYKIEINESENKFSQRFFSDDNLVLDQVLPDNIELCDVLLDYKSVPKLVHIKKGFNNTTRDLTAQIEIAAKRLNRSLTSGDITFIDKAYNSLKSKGKLSTQYFQKVGQQQVTQKVFRDIFKNKKNFCFCLALVDTAKNERNLSSEIEKFNSNIAKFSIINLSRSLKLLNIELKVVQIFQE